MSLKTLIDDCAAQADGWGRTAIRTLIQAGQDKLFDYDSPYCVFYDPTNEGWPPYLKTTAGTYRYEIIAANLSCALTRSLGGSNLTVRAKRVTKVFIESSNIDYGRRYVGSPYLYQYVNPYSTDVSRMEVADIPVDSGPALNNTSAWVTFKEDPGTSTNKYFVRFTWEAPRLTSESIPLAVNEEFEEGLEDYVIGIIQKRQNGQVGDRLNNFYGFWVNKWHHDSASGAQTSPRNTASRFC